MSKLSLAARRKELIERCAEQRTGLAYELRALRPSKVIAGHPALSRLAGVAGMANRKLVLGALGTGLGVALLRRKRLLGLAGSAMSAWRTASGALALLGRLR